MTLRRGIATLTAVAGCALGVAAPAAAATPAAGAVREITRGLLPTSTSWPKPLSGIVLGYPSLTAGAKPSLIVTGNGGRTWRSLPPPPVRFPADNNLPDATWAGGTIAVTDGTHVVATRDAGQHWSAVRLAGASGKFAVDHLTIAHGRVFALVTTIGNTTGSSVVYSGQAQAGVLRPVRGLSITGSLTYGDITAAGTLQVDLGADFAAERYWYSSDGVHFTPAPLPCPAMKLALLGGVHAGRVSALCSGSPSDVGPGQNDKQVFTAAHLGGTFRRSGPVFDSPNEQDFAASSQAMAVATIFTLAVTFNAGRTWTVKLIKPNGAFWTDLSFPSATTGVVVSSTVNNALKQVANVYRTTDAGRTWHPLSLP